LLVAATRPEVIDSDRHRPEPSGELFGDGALAGARAAVERNEHRCALTGVCGTHDVDDEVQVGKHQANVTARAMTRTASPA
jgi:hypothetical protein